MAGPRLAHAMAAQTHARAQRLARPVSAAASRHVRTASSPVGRQLHSDAATPPATTAPSTRLRTQSASPALGAQQQTSRPSSATGIHARSASAAASAAGQTAVDASVALGTARAAVAAVASAAANAARGSRPNAPSAADASDAASTDGPVAEYARMVASGHIRDDPHQRQTVALLQTLHDQLRSYTPPQLPPPRVEKRRVMAQVGSDAGRDKIKSPDFAWIDETEQSVFGIVRDFFENVFGSQSSSTSSKVSAPKGLYLYGDVGTGKTMTMDLFYNTASVARKRRIHFHEFMQETHKRIHHLRTHDHIASDPIPLIASELANETHLLCFDELQVTDITDAMLIRRLFSELFQRGVVMVMTSNRHPDDLYQNGIQRSSFIPAIQLIKSQFNVHSLNSGIDYRRRAGESDIVPYFTPLGADMNTKMTRLMSELSGNAPIAPKSLSLWGRSLVIDETSGHVAKIPFQQLCGSPHSAADYLEISKSFDVVMVTDVPRMSLSHRNEARRFITLIDALYDHKTRFIMSMETDLPNLFSGDNGPTGVVDTSDRMLMDDLKLTTDQATSSIFTGAEEVFAFQRAMSRLIEMQSKEWMGSDLVRAIKKIMA